MIKNLFTFFLFIHFCTVTLGQNTRIEIKLNRIPNDVEVISLNKKGFLLIYTGGERRGDARNAWNISKFNSNFEEAWNKSMEIPSRFTVENYINDSVSNRLIWFSKSATQFRLDIIELKDGIRSTQTYSLGKHAKELVGSKIVGNDLFILFKYGPESQASTCFAMCCFPISVPLNYRGVSLFNYGSIYTKIDLEKQMKYERVDVTKGMEMPDKIQDDGYLTVSSFKHKHRSGGKTYLNVKNLNANLSTRDSFKIESPKNHYLQNIQLTTAYNGYAGIGTFNQDPPDPNDLLNIIEAKGIYTVILDSTQHLKFIKVIPFHELGSFQTYIENLNKRRNRELSEDSKKRLKNRYKNYSTMLRFNEIIERENDFIATVEAFYPVYSSYRDAAGNVIRYFDGYNYTYCLIVCFDKNGNLKWDQTVPLNFNRLYLNLSQKVKILQDSSEVQLIYGSGSTINMVSIVGDSIHEPKKIKLPRLLKEDAKASEYDSDITPWHGKKYIIWGVQKIRKSDIKDRDGSNLIYLDEIELNP